MIISDLREETIPESGLKCAFASSIFFESSRKFIYQLLFNIHHWADQITKWENIAMPKGVFNMIYILALDVRYYTVFVYIKDDVSLNFNNGSKVERFWEN